MIDPTLAIELAEDRKIGQSITALGWQDPLLAARDVATRHSARVDMPELDPKGGWRAVARGVRTDAEQNRQEWKVVGRGDTSDAAIADLVEKLEARKVETPAVALCQACGQPLPG